MRNNKGVFVAIVGMVIVYSLFVRASQSRASNREGANSREYAVRMGRMNWRFLSLVVAAFVLLTLTSVLSDAGQSIGIVFLGFGLAVAAFLSAYWYELHPNPECRNSTKFFSLLAANVILFALFGFLVPHVPAAGAIFGGLLAVVFSFSVWPLINDSDRDLGRLELMRDIVKTFFVLLVLLGIALTLEGLGRLTGLDVLGSMGRELARLFGGS